MDVNGTRFHLVLGRDDWLGPAAAVPDAVYDAARQTVELEPLPVVFPPRRTERAPTEADRRGAGRDQFGNWYWISDDARGIVARSPRDTAPLPFWPHRAAEITPPEPAAGDFAPVEPPLPAEPPRLQGLAVTTEHYLVVGEPDAGALVVFDLAAGGPPVTLRWPADLPFEPWDICAAPGGGVWVLDLTHTRLWSLDRLFRVRTLAPPPPLQERPEFTPHLTTPPDHGAAHDVVLQRPGPVTLDSSLDVSFVSGPAAVEALGDGSALVLGYLPDGPVVHRFTVADGRTDAYPLGPLLVEHPEVAADLAFGNEFAFVAAEGEGTEGRLFVVAPDGNQAFAFNVSGAPDELHIEFDRRFFPMRRYGGRALVVAAGEAHYDSGDRWVALLEYPRPNFRRELALRLPAGGAVGAFDGREPGCVWHRLFLDACIPPGSSVTVESRAADALAELAAREWTAEPTPYLRAGASEIPYLATFTGEPLGQAGTWELLFQRAVGRYLQLRVTLRGNGRITPKVRALRAYYPRFSYLREYLPAVYREDEGSAWLMDRYLANVEGLLTEVEGRIAAAQLLFDAHTVPADFLEWLAGWMGATLDEAWTERKKRVFLANSMSMFAGRGTRAGLIRALRLALEEEVDPALFGGGSGRHGGSSTGSDTGAVARFTVRVVEQFLTRDAPGVAYGDVGDLAGPATTTAALEWTPAQGPEPLHRRWRNWLATRYTDLAALEKAWEEAGYTSFDDVRLKLPAITPCHPTKAADWSAFRREGLGFTYAAPDVADLALWRDFLARRYRQPMDLNRAWGLGSGQAYVSFADVGFPATIPDRGTPLADWITFVSLVAPMRHAAHRFTVLVPVAPGDDRETQRRRRDLARRIALLEKPAHTVVETRLYWAAFRVGEARLGTDTVLGQGSRFTALVLERGELGGSHLGWAEPWNVGGRRVVGRDPVTASPHRAN